MLRVRARSIENQTDDMIKAFTGTARNTNAVESYFGSIKYYEDMFHCGVDSANGLIAAKVDELFDVLAPNYIARGKQRVDDKRASASTRKKRRRLSARKGRFSAAALGAEREDAIMEVSRERRRGPLI